MPAYFAGRLLAVVPVVFVISLLAFGLEAITLAVNFFGDAVRDRLDPRLKRTR